MHERGSILLLLEYELLWTTMPENSLADSSESLHKRKRTVATASFDYITCSCLQKNSVTEPSHESQPSKISLALRTPVNQESFGIQSLNKKSSPASSQTTAEPLAPQHVILTSAVTSSSNHCPAQQSILLSSYQNKNRAIQSIFHEHAVRDLPATGLIVKAIPRNDVIFSSPVAELVVHQVSTSSIPTSTSQE